MTRLPSTLRIALPLPLLAGLPLAAEAQYQEMARVISSTPVVTQVATPRQVCSQGQVLMATPKSGAGALLGAAAGGAIGHQIGGGTGRTLATAVGVIGGAVVGDSFEAAPPPVVQTVNSCTQQIGYEQRVTAYNVTYEYAGRQYTVQMPNDPGPYLPLQISPATAGMPAAPAAVAPPVIVSTPVYSAPVYTAPVYSAPVYAGPSYFYSYSYPAPVWYGAPSMSFRFGYGGGRDGHRHHDHHRHHPHRNHHWR